MRRWKAALNRMQTVSSLHLHLEKYLPQCEWRRSHLLLPRLGEDLQSSQLLTVLQAASAGREADASAADGASVPGLLKTDRCGELSIEDSTGQVTCEFSKDCTEHAQFRLGESVVLLKQWVFVPPANIRRYNGYFEVSRMVVLWNEQGPTPSSQEDVFTIASLKQSLKTHSKRPARSKVNIVAIVSAVGEILGNGQARSCTFAVELRDDSDPSHQFPLVVQTPSLLHVSGRLVVGEKYLFTQLRDKVMNKGVATEQRVLVTTAESAVQTYDSYLECQPPKSKRFKEAEPGSHDHNLAPPHSNNDFVSYQGVLTECVLPEAGLYKMDNTVLLYMGDRHCSNGGRGLRRGASIELLNVHALKLPPPLQHASGFYCCARSSVHISHFSSTFDLFKPFSSMNKLAYLIKKYSPADAAYLILTYISLKKRYRPETSFKIIENLPKIAGFSPLEKDEITDFFSSPHSCPFTQTKDHHSNHLVVASNLRHFCKSVEERMSALQLQWRGEDNQLAGSEMSSSLQGCHAERVEWSYATLSRHEAPAQVLVGRLEGCVKTGRLTITDESGAVPVLCLMPLTTPSGSTHTELLKAIGSTVLLSGLTVYAEKKSSSKCKDSTPPLTYLHASNCTVITSPPPGGGCGLYFAVVSKNCVVSTTQFGVRFTAHVMMGKSLQSVRPGTNHTGQVLWSSEAVEVALCFTNEAFKWYDYIINGGVYYLSSPSPSSSLSPHTSSSSNLPPLTDLSQTNSLTVCGDMKLELVNTFLQPQLVYDATSVIERVTLPGFLNKTTPTNKRMWAELISLKGVVITHEYRLPHSSLSATPTAATPSQPCETILALKVQSLTHPDTVMVYYRMGEGQPHPLGLLPGSLATFHSFTLRISKSWNVYFENTASSSITLHCLSDTTGYHPSHGSGLTPQMLALPTAYLSDLMRDLLSGSLSCKVVCVQCRVTSVQRLSLQYKCLSCGCSVVDGNCMVACPMKRPISKVEGRFILDDGSGNGHLYANDDLVMDVLGVAQREWAELNEIVIKTGYLAYSKAYSEQPQVDSGCSMLPAKDRGNAMMSKFASRAATHRPIKVYCQPFVSSAELQESEVGRKQQVRRGYNTLCLPRLQLRAVSVLELTGSVCSDTTRQLLEKYNNINSNE